MRREKAFVSFRGRPMIASVLETAQGVFTRVSIVSNHTESFRHLGVPIIPDIYRECGPVGGLHAALVSADAEEVFALACDTPFVSEQLLEYIASSIAPGRARVALMGGRVHPLCGVYPASALSIVTHQLETHRLTMAELIAELDAATVPIHPGLPFYRTNLLQNINDPLSLRAAETS